MDLYEKRIIITFFIFVLYFFLPLWVFAEEIKNIHYKVKTKQLPQYCLCAGYPPPSCTEENRSNHEELYGEIFLHIHHYCWGLDKLNMQLQSGTPSSFWLENVISEFDYVLGHKDPKKKINAEIFTKKGQVLLMLNKNMEAVNSFYNAIKFNKKYVPAYLSLSQYLNKIGDRDGACKILKLGLGHNPGSKALKAQFSTICQKK